MAQVMIDADVAALACKLAVHGYLASSSAVLRWARSRVNKLQNIVSTTKARCDNTTRGCGGIGMIFGSSAMNLSK